MFCGKCGAEIENDAKFCGSCGEVTVVEETVSQQVNAEESAPAEGVSEVQAAGTAAPAFKLNNKLIGIIACGVIALAAVIAGIFIFGSEKPETVVEKYANASMTGNYNEIKKYSAYNVDKLVKAYYEAEGYTEKEFNEMLKDEYDVKNIDEYYKKNAEESKKYLSEEFGKNYKFTVKVKDFEKYTTKERKEFIEEIREEFEDEDFDIKSIINLDKITEVAVYGVELTISGSEKKDSMEDELYLVKIGGKWRVLEDFDNFVVG